MIVQRPLASMLPHPPCEEPEIPPHATTDMDEIDLHFSQLQSRRLADRLLAIKALAIISEKYPEILYPDFDIFETVFYHDNKSLKYYAVNIISNLATVDTKNKISEHLIEEILARYRYDVLFDDLKVAVHLWNIALHKKEFRKHILDEFNKTTAG